ncbi:MAG: hypothetical protein WBF13_10845 [Candidatus Zixiibacteriota bacterium]
MLRDNLNISLTWLIRIALIMILLTPGVLQETKAQRRQGMGSLGSEKCSFRLRDNNRKEGVLDGKPVSGGVELISATIDCSDQTESKDMDSCFIGFFLQQESKVQITVCEPNSLYMMTPLKKTFPSGFSKFGWPRDAVLARLDIDLGDLYALVDVEDSDPLAIAPVVLYYGEPPADTIEGYRFVFTTDTGCDFKYRIVKLIPTGFEIIYENQLVAQPPGEVLITWDGRDKHGQFLEDGPCELNVTVTLYSHYEANSRVVFIRYFYHKCEVP